MKKIYFTLIALLFPLLMSAQGWPSNYNGVMLQGFYWDSFDASQWKRLESQTGDLSPFFKLVWLPQSANCGGTSMGYDDLYWFNDYNSSFGNETQLRSLISTFKSNGIGTIADVVINHRKTLNSWVDFPSETYNGVTYQMLSTDICANDDGGNTKTWAQANGYSLSSNNDTGEGWDGMRDLDHNSANVQKSVKAYLNMLLNDFGYAGFRYDMVKGYAGSFTGTYNNETKPTYSVGEYWDGNSSSVINWLNATKVNGNIQSAAFDFPFRYTVRDAVNNSNWSALANASVMSNADYRQYAVTFIENHDTEYRSASAQQDPIKKDTLAANAFLLAMPGTPCVFFKHWIDCKDEIKPMIDARNAAGITNTSTYANFRSSTQYYANKVQGTKGELIVAVGNLGYMNDNVLTDYTKILRGYHYAYYLSKSTETAWTDKSSGEYDNAFDVTLTAVSATDGAKLVYTTDGTTPTASSKSVTSGSKINISSSCTIKVGLLIGSTVKGIVTRNYTISDFKPYTITVNVNVDAVGWTRVNFWSWGGDGKNGPVASAWPGDNVTATKTVNGKKWYYKTFSIDSSDDAVSFVFSTGTGSPQTVDVTSINKDSYFEISSATTGGKNNVNDVTSSITGINDITIDNAKTANNIYSIDGRLVRSNATSTQELNNLNKGIYIMNGKKYIVK